MRIYLKSSLSAAMKIIQKQQHGNNIKHSVYDGTTTRRSEQQLILVAEVNHEVSEKQLIIVAEVNHEVSSN